MSALPPLSIDEKRQVVYSSLLRYSSEVIPLRERVLDRVVLGALIGSSEADPFRIGHIQENLKFGPNAPEIRIQPIQEAIRRLAQHSKVESTLLRERHAYYLSEQGKTELGSLIGSAEPLFNSVLTNMLRDIGDACPKELGIEVCRTFILECFARYGQVIAKNVTGHISHETLMRSLDTASAFNAAIQGKHLSSTAIESLHARCYLFLKSSDPDDERLKFYLTQGYYFAQLLGLEDRGFNPLNDHAFAGATFYLDSNVLIIGVLHPEDSAALFDEMVGIATRIGIELRVTRATLNETRRVAADRRVMIEKILDKVPDELFKRTDDQFLRGFLQARESNSSLTPAAFLEPFDFLEDTLQRRWKITLDDRTEDEITDGKDFGRIGQVLNEAAEVSRGFAKSEAVLNHDVSHYVLICDERLKNPKTWFLTRDRSLAEAAVKLAVTDTVFCFSLIGFLHSISPFLTSPAEEGTLVDAFSAMLSEQVFPMEPVFEASELTLMAEYHEDVMATPTDQLVRAFDYIKLKTLQGKRYRRSDIPQVSLELHKFLASSREEQMSALQVERTRVEGAREVEEGRRRAAEAVVDERDAEIKSLKQHQETMQGEIERVNAELSRQSVAQSKEQQRRRAVYMTFGFITGGALWRWSDSILRALIPPTPPFWPSAITGIAIIKLLGALVFSIPSFLFLRGTNWKDRTKVAAASIIIIVTLVLSQLLDKELLSMTGSLVESAAFLVALVLAAGLISRNGGSHNGLDHP